MHLCYLDESGTPEIPGTTSHYILAGLSIPIWHWRMCDAAVAAIKQRYALDDEELHTAWLLRPLREQTLIPGFDTLKYFERRQKVEILRRAELLRLQKTGDSKRYKQVRKNYLKTEAYIHLTLAERQKLLQEVAHLISSWGFARLFAECIDKVNYTSKSRTTDEDALEQVVSRFEHYLRYKSNEKDNYGLLIHDNNDTVARKHTSLMQKFHKSGTLWVDIKHIMETPLFVDSKLTSMVQLADICSYALRRYLENSENELFDLIFNRADRLANDKVVGVRHFTPSGCTCKICSARNR